MSVKTPLKLEGIITIKLIDKKSNKVVYEKRVKNAIHQNFALVVCAALAGDESYPYPVADRVELWDTGGNYIKGLGESQMTTREWRHYSDHEDLHIVFRDTSSDEYTVGSVALWADITKDSTSYQYTLAVQKNLNVSKASDQVLVIDWVINVPYQTTETK